MTNRNWIVLTTTDAAAATALNTRDAAVAPRVIDNPRADSLGPGGLVGALALPQRILEHPGYMAWRGRLADLPVVTADAGELFVVLDEA